MNAKSGFRQKKDKTAKQQLKELHATVANMQQVMNIQKIMFEQFANNMGKLDRDVHNSMGVLNDLQYRTLALVELAGDKDKINDIAESLKLKDYNEASDKEDAEKNLVPDTEVKEDSTVILTSECKDDTNRSIFRTKFKVDEELVVKDIKDKLVGLCVGDKVDVKLPDGLEHTIEVVGIRKYVGEVRSAEDDTEQVSEKQ